MSTRAVEWDPYAPDAVADPRASWAELRDHCPVAWSERMSGFWAVSRYDDVVAIARASERFNNSGGPQFGTSRPPLEVDRPEHTFFRRVLQPHFSKERVALLEPGVRGFVAEMLAPALESGEADLAEALTYPLPARTLCLWLGLPDEEWAVLKSVSERLFEAEEGRGDDPAVRASCNEELYAYSRRIVRERVERPLGPATLTRGQTSSRASSARATAFTPSTRRAASSWCGSCSPPATTRRPAGSGTRSSGSRRSPRSSAGCAPSRS